MLIVTGSGHVGQYLLKKVKAKVKMKLPSKGIAGGEDKVEEQRYWDTLTVRTLERWRAVHMPLVAVLLALTMLHILSIAYFLNWS
jgi:hypothetical protein